MRIGEIPGHNRMMSPSARLGWLAIPAFLGVLMLIGLGVSTEGRSEFERRSAESDQSGIGDQADQDRAVPRQDGQTRSRAGDGGENQAADVGSDGGPPAEITVATETGEIVIQVDENGQPIRLTPIGPGGSGDTVDIDPDDLVAVRLTEDGRLEVVPLDQIGPDDTVVVPADGGFDLERPDGSVVEFRADGENGGMTATEISPDGEVVELEPNSDGSVTLSDGTTVGPIDFVDDLGPIERLIDQTRDLPWPLLVGAVLLLAGASIALALYLHRKRSDETFDFGKLAGTGVPDDRFDRFLDSLGNDPDPSRAVRIGFSVAERGLGGIQQRRVDETPFEWHRRVSDAVGPGADPALTEALGTVCDLFARARFAPGQSSEQDRRDMIDALRRLHQLGRRSADQGPPAGAGLEPEPEPERQQA